MIHIHIIHIICISVVHKYLHVNQNIFGNAWRPALPWALQTIKAPDLKLNTCVSCVSPEEKPSNFDHSNSNRNHNFEWETMGNL